MFVPPFHFLYPQLYLPRGTKTQKPKSKISVDTLLFMLVNIGLTAFSEMIFGDSRVKY